MIRPLVSADVSGFCALRKQSFVTDPLSWDYDPGYEVATEEWAPKLERTSDNIVLGYFITDAGAEPELAGMIGLTRFDKLKRRHRATIWGVYVSPAARGRRAAAQLLDEALLHARNMDGLDHLILSVSHHATAALHLYTVAGFTEWGREVRAARTGNTWMDEIHLRLEI